METPPLPQVNRDEKRLTTKKIAERTAKTPFQYGSSFQRSFKSELQPNRIASRIQQDANLLKSGSRFYPATSQRPANGRLNNESTSSKNAIVSRLGNLIQYKGSQLKPTIVEPKPSVLSSSTTADNNRTFSRPPLATTTPAASFRQQPKTPYRQQQQPQPQKQKQEQEQQPQLQPPQPQQQPQHHQQQLYSHQQPQQQQTQQPILQREQNSLHQPQTRLDYATSCQSQVKTKPQLHLIQDTRGPHQQPGPVATCTKAPLSVSQYTQPTPGASNKSNQQVSRAHSEPSIKYHVQVNGKTYKILRKIGSGGSAKVYEGFESQTSQTVAIKIINMAQADPRTKESYFNENSLLARLRDTKYVVRMFDSEYKAECKELVIVMEKGDADLSQVIESHFKARKSMIDGIFIKFYWRGMLQAVNCIHQQGIVHADLKPVNFILVKNEIKLIDFGIASAIAPEGTSIIRDYQIGTINYMAPEALRNRAADASFQYLNGRDNMVDENNPQQPATSQKRTTVIKYNSKADIWSLGCILYNLVYGRPPFDKFQDIISKAQAITNPAHQIHFPELSNRNLLKCMKSCLRYNPADRPTAHELLNDIYLREDIVVLQGSA